MGTHLTPNGPEPSDNTPVIKHPHAITVMCQECQSLIEVKDVHAWIISCHLAVCSEMVLLTGERD